MVRIQPDCCGSRRPGLVIIGYASKPSQIVLPAQKFNDYLVEEGLENVAALRAKRNETNAEARESFARCAKALISSGPVTAADADRALGFTLELIAERNPYALAGRPVAARSPALQEPATRRCARRRGEPAQSGGESVSALRQGRSRHLQARGTGHVADQGRSHGRRAGWRRQSVGQLLGVVDIRTSRRRAAPIQRPRSRGRCD